MVYRERSVASYARSFRLAQEVDQAESGAKLENGVLTLTLPKPWRARCGSADSQLSSAIGQRGRTSKAPSVLSSARPYCQRIAAARAIMAPLSVHRASGG